MIVCHRNLFLPFCPPPSQSLCVPVLFVSTSVPPTACLPVSLSAHPSACLPVSMSVCPSACLSVCLPICVYLSIWEQVSQCVLSAAFSTAAVSLHHVNRPPELFKMTLTIFLPSGLWHKTKPPTCLFLSSSEPGCKPSLCFATHNNNTYTSWNYWVLRH